MQSPSERNNFLIRGALALVTVVSLLAATGVPAFANPRVSGRITKIMPQRRLIVMQRGDGKLFRAVLRPDATLERLGVPTRLTQFRVGDYAVVAVCGPLNEDPLDCDGLFDVQSAGKAPPPSGSVDRSVEGGFAIPGGSAALMPHPPSPSGMVGGSQNVLKPTFTPSWNPTEPWDGVPTDPGRDVPPPVVKPPPLPSMTPFARHLPDATVNAYGSTRASQKTTTPDFPATPHGGTMTAAPSPSGNPWLAQAVGRNNAGETSASRRLPSTSSPVVTPSVPVTTTRMPPPAPASSNPVQFYDDSPGGIASAARPGMDIVSLLGSVTQLNLVHRQFTVQTLVGGRAQMVTVRVPLQVGVMNGRSQQKVGLENIRIGDYVMVTGIQITQGAVEARTLYVNQ